MTVTDLLAPGRVVTIKYGASTKTMSWLALNSYEFELGQVRVPNIKNRVWYFHLEY